MILGMRGMSPRVERLLSAWYPEYMDEGERLRLLVDSYRRPGMRILDAGCGRKSFFWMPDCVVFGVDVSPQVVENANVLGVFANLGHLPFCSESMDLAISTYVFEHLENPGAVLRELARVLRPGGRLFVLTPNCWHYVTLAARLTPLSFHRWYNLRRGRAEEDTFPTRYKANSRSTLAKLSSEAGFRIVSLQTWETQPNYLLWSLPLFIFGVLYERIVNKFDWLAGFRVEIFAVFEKVG